MITTISIVVVLIGSHYVAYKVGRLMKINTDIDYLEEMHNKLIEKMGEIGLRKHD